MLRLNHYWVKSREEFLRKGRLNAKGYMAGKENSFNFERFNAQSSGYRDEGEILLYLENLKARIAGRSQNVTEALSVVSGADPV